MHYYVSSPDSDLQWLREGSDKSKSINEKQSKFIAQKLDKAENLFVYLERLYPLLIQISEMIFRLDLRRSM